MGLESACAGQFWAWVGRVWGLGVGFFGGVFAARGWDRLDLQGVALGFGGRRVMLGHGGLS